MNGGVATVNLEADPVAAPEPSTIAMVASAVLLGLGYPMFGVARRNPLRRKGRIFN